MYPELLVEIALTRSGAIPEDLIVRAYAASRFEPIALILNGIAAQLVNTFWTDRANHAARYSGRSLREHEQRWLHVGYAAGGKAGLHIHAWLSIHRDSEWRQEEPDPFPEFAFLIPSEVKPSWHGSVQAARLMNVEQIPPAGTYEIVQRRLSLLRHEMQLAKSNPRIGR